MAEEARRAVPWRRMTELHQRKWQSRTDTSRFVGKMIPLRVARQEAEPIGESTHPTQAPCLSGGLGTDKFPVGACTGASPPLGKLIILGRNDQLLIQLQRVRAGHVIGPLDLLDVFRRAGAVYLRGDSSQRITADNGVSRAAGRRYT